MSAARLSRATHTGLPYDPAKVRIGVVHLGPGAFHRAHQAWYFHRLLARDPTWGVSAISLRSDDLRAALAAQDGLYILAQLDAEIRFETIGAFAEVLTAPRDPDAVLARLADPAVKLLTATITEKGYCLAPDGTLDFAHADIAADLAHPDRPTSAIGWVVEGLRLRRAAGLAPFTVVSCDNLTDNGHRLRTAVIALAGRRDPALAGWIEAAVHFPRAMVDSITPATDDALRARVEAATGLADAWPIQREAFTQWVIEDLDDPALAPLATVGVTFTKDIAGFEAAKLRLLNGPHSTLAYVGLARGHEAVCDAMTDPVLADFIERLMREDIVPFVEPAPGLDLAGYIDAVLARFRNPAIRHRLAQIAWDGSQKLPIRLMGTIAEAIAAGAPLNRLAVPIAAWARFIITAARAGQPIIDPMAERLLALGRGATGPEPFIDLEVVPHAVKSSAAFRAAVRAAYDRLPEIM